MWYLIVSIPDLCTLSYFTYFAGDLKYRRRIVKMIQQGVEVSWNAVITFSKSGSGIKIGENSIFRHKIAYI